MAYEQNTGRELGWDDQIEHDSPDFITLPEGEYDFTVTSFERGRHTPREGGKLPPCHKAILTIQVDAPEGSTTLTHNLFLHTRTEGLLCEFFTCIGHRKHGEPLKMDWPRVTGATGRCRLGIRSWISDKNGEERFSNEIKRFLEPEQSAATAPAAPATPGFTPGSF